MISFQYACELFDQLCEIDDEIYMEKQTVAWRWRSKFTQLLACKKMLSDLQVGLDNDCEKIVIDMSTYSNILEDICDATRRKKRRWNN